MSAIARMQQADVITGRMVREAIREAKADPSQMGKLQEACNSCAGRFDDVRQYDTLVSFLQQYYQDSFEFRPNTSNPAARPATVTEARITKLRTIERTVDVTPPPTAPTGRYRDPLNMTGTAEAGAKVEFYNASQPGRPVIGETTADATGHFRFELTDETKFVYGDQIGVRVIDDSGEPSRAIVVPTEPFRMDVTRTTYRRGSTVLRTDETAHVHALSPNTDERTPFYQPDKVELRFTPPAAPGAPYRLELHGADDAVEPNSTLSIRVGGQTYETRADAFGKFALKVFGFEPGQDLKLEIKDVNGKGVDLSYRAPPVSLNIEALTAGVARPPSPRKPDGVRESVGEGPPWLHVKAADVTVPHGAVILHNRNTGDLYELTADENGRVNAAVGGLEPFDTLDVATRDADGNVSAEAKLLVLLPEKLGQGKGFLVAAESLNQAQPDVASVIECIQGPPEDLYVNGQRDPRGPFLKMPDVTGMPPFGQLAVVRDGRVIQYLRADKEGRLQGLLRGVNVGDQLNFQVLDAAGRKFPMELSGWRVPGAGQTSKVPAKHVHTDDRTLGGALAEVGNGSLDLRAEALEPFEIRSGAVMNPETKAPLHYRREFFGKKSADEERTATFDFFPPSLVEKLKLTGGSGAPSARLALEENAGTRRITVGFEGRQQYTVGVDYVMGRVNRGDPNQAIEVPAHLSMLTEGLRTTLGFVALAYDAGKEPGDMEYDRAMSAAKTFLYVFDRLAVHHPDHKEAIQNAAKAAFPEGGFPFELIDRMKVPPQGATSSAEPARAARSSAMGVLDARLAALGKVSGVGTVGQSDGASHPAPRVEGASVLELKRTNHNTSYESSVPLRVRGTATPGDIVQVYNVSTGNKTLLAEAIAGPDGRYDIVGGLPGSVKLGDQLGVMSVTSDGKKSPLMVVPTDGYTYASRLSEARPAAYDERPPYLRTAETELKNVSFDESGAARPGGPFWRLDGNELSVEPFSKLTVHGKTPDGKDVKVETQVDADGRFSVEFPHRPRSGFTVSVEDRNGNRAGFNLRTPGLAETIQTGDDSAAAAVGAVAFQLPNGEEVRGIVVASSIGNTGNDDPTRILAEERSDTFVDVVVEQKYTFTDSQGRQGDRSYRFKVKIAKEEAQRFSTQFGEQVRMNAPSFANLLLPGNENFEMQLTGDAKVVDRDFGLL